MPATIVVVIIPMQTAEKTKPVVGPGVNHVSVTRARKLLGSSRRTRGVIAGDSAQNMLLQRVHIPAKAMVKQAAVGAPYSPSIFVAIAVSPKTIAVRTNRETRI